MANFTTMSQNRRRPKRQRTPTTIYTDDNPTTFTTKKKKGQNNGQHDDDDNFSPRSSSSKASPKVSLPVDQHFPVVEESSTCMPPPAPIVKRGPGRPPRRKTVDQMMSVSGGNTRAAAATYVTTNKIVIPDPSVSSPPVSVPATIPSAPDEQLSSPIVTKRKRGRPPKNRPKEVPVVNHSTSELDENYTKDNIINQCHHPIGNVPATCTSMMHLQDADPAVDNRSNMKTMGRRSLPEASTEMKANDDERSRRSLDSIISSKKRNDVCSGNNNTAIDVASTRNSNIQRTTKMGTSPLLFRARTNSSASWTPPQQDIEGAFVNHSITVAPILPPVLIRDNDEDSDVVNSNENCREELTHDGSSSHNSSEFSMISRELKSKYPVVYDKGVSKASSSIAPPFSSTSQISSGTSSTSSFKHKFNQSQNQLSQLPAWSPLYNPPVFFEDDYDRETGHLDVKNTIPVTRHITAMTVRKPDHDYLVLGDSVGFVSIYSLAKDNINLPIAQLESVACQQRGKMEQERLRTDLLKRKKQTRGSAKGGNAGRKSSSFKYSNMSGHFSNSNGARPGTPNQMQTAFASGPQHMRSIVIDTSDTTIQALGMIENRVVLATSEELECMDVPSGTSLWVCPLSSNRFVTSLDMHLNTFDVLVSCSKTGDSTEAAVAPISPLMLLQHSENNVEICDANSPMLVRSPSCSAIWDVGARNRLLFIALSSNRQEHELVLVSGGSIDSWKVACKTKIPTKTSSATSAAAATKLSQSAGGMYTLVASSRGIRLYQTESLQLIHVYGDQLALHGQSVMWKNCWLAGSFFSEKNKNITKAARGLPSQWLQCEDWLRERIEEKTTRSKNAKTNNDDEDDPKNEKTPNLAPYIIGVPHTKGPKELCENLHVWKVEHPSVVPMMSIPLPHKTEGALGLVGSGNKSSSNSTGASEDRIVLVTNDGQGHLLLPKMESNFAGIVYPPGYQVVTDNIEYIEDEDATDYVVADNKRSKRNCDTETEDTDVDLLGQGGDDESMDEEMREAMRQSLMEHKKHEIVLEAMKHDAVVDILGTNEKKDKEFLPCRPEPYLRQMIDTLLEGDETLENVIKEKEVKLHFAPSSETPKFNGIDVTKSSKIVAIKPKLTDAIFISKVLDIMPNRPKSKPLEEDCLSFTTTKVVVAMNPVLPIRPGRGRKSRAANLETMLKASINPYLQSLMLSRQGVAVNGQGSSLRDVKNGARTNSTALPNESTKTLKSFARSLSRAAESKLDAGSERMNGGLYSSSDSSIAILNVKPSTSPRQASNDDEAAVVMGLLGLSPSHTTNVPNNSFALSDCKEVEIGCIAVNSEPKGSTYLSSSPLTLLGVKNEDSQVDSALSSDHGSAIEATESMTDIAVEKSKLGITDKFCSACRGRHVIHSCGKRSLPIDYEEIARAERERKEKEEEEKKRVRSEKRRLADQKRREAKKQKQRELEDQRLREGKERLQDEQRRRLREDFASQDLNHQRREQVVASYMNRISIDRSHRTQSKNEIHSLEYAKRQNLELTPLPYSNDSRENTLPQSTYNNYQRTADPQVAASFIQPSQTHANSNVFEQGTQIIQESLSKDEGGTTYSNHVVGNEIGVSIPSTSNEHAAYTESAQSPLAQATLPSISATIASADALVALANLADYTKTLPVTESHSSGCATASNKPKWSSYALHGKTTSSNTGESASNQFDAPSFATSHGFGTHANVNDSASYDVSGEVKRGIPSYATIRDQFTNGSPNDVASAMTNTLTATTSFSNGFIHQKGDSKAYSWSTRSDDHD